MEICIHVFINVFILITRMVTVKSWKSCFGFSVIIMLWLISHNKLLWLITHIKLCQYLQNKLIKFSAWLSVSISLYLFGGSLVLIRRVSDHN